VAVAFVPPPDGMIGEVDPPPPLPHPAKEIATTAASAPAHSSLFIMFS
jgi:hypothetical protein